MKMVTINAIAKSQNSRALSKGFGDLENCARLVNSSGRNNKGIAFTGSIIKVKKAMAAAGRPKPRKPFTIPEIKNMLIIKTTIGISVVGKKLDMIVVKNMLSLKGQGDV